MHIQRFPRQRALTILSLAISSLARVLFDFTRSIINPVTAVRVILLWVVFSVSLSACSGEQYRTGLLPDSNKVKGIKVGVSTKADVSNLIGSPSSVSPFNSDIWYYISQQRQRRILASDKIVSQTVLAMGFDDQAVLRGTRVYTLEDGALITPNKDVTPTEGRTVSLYEEIIGNIGRFGAGK